MKWPRRIRWPRWLRRLGPRTWRKRLRRRQWIAIGVATAALIVGLSACFVLRPRRLDLRALAEKHGRATGLDPALILAMIQNESAGKPDAVSRVGARGLMQLMPRTAEDVARRHGIRYRGPDDLLQPDLNVRLGTIYLASLRRMFHDDPYLYIAAYNAGPGRVQKWCAQCPGIPSREVIARAAFAETKSYVKLVLRAWEAAKGG